MSQFFGTVRRYRWKEFRLYIIPILILLLAMTQLLLADKDPRSSFSTKALPPIQGLIPVLGLVAFLLATNLLLSFSRLRRADQMLLPLVGLLSGLGMLMATRLGPDVGLPSEGTRQLIWIIVGIVLCIAVLFALRDMRWLRRYYYVWALLAFALVATTLVNTLHVHNLDSPTHDQLNIGPINFQPSEFLKICIVIFFAAVLSENSDIFAAGNLRIGPLRLPPVRQLIPILVMLGIALLFFLVVRELGLALLVYGTYLCMIYLGTGKFSYVAVGLVLFFLLGFVGYFLFSYVRARFQAVTFNVLDWQNWTPAQTDFAENGGLQIVQGLIALSSGGILGAGLGLGHAGLYVPVAQSDMIFTALGEEFGLAGLFAILGLYLLIIYRGYRIAIESSDSFSKLLAAGLTSIFAIQTIIIIAGNMKFFPLTGIPLPFLSYGGSSIVANFIIIGVLLRISYNNAVEREGIG
ncbi:MAG TPA: FtsW/RodA/SpoVE family cell cycle protein [Ktedonobacteraceae bacterium]|nr:FtsW/RodA/SpoVE family cell cycle protein [Ktedonobacteraceae bacterium]